MRSVAVKAVVVAVALVTGMAFGQTDKRTIERTGKIAAAKASGERWAVVVGVDVYQSKAIEPLAGAVADAKAIRDALIKYADFPADQVKLLVSDGAIKPTKTDIVLQLEEIKASVKPTDLLLFFFAGHGVQVDGQRYLLTYDARIDNAALIKTTAYAASNLMQELESVRVAHRVIMIDACRNDPTKPGNKPNVADEAFEMVFSMPSASEGGVRATFLSTSKGQSAYEWSEKRRGFFSFFIERGLSGEAAQYGKVTVTSLLGYLNEMVPQKVREQKNQLQIPYAKVDGAELILVRAEKVPAIVATLDKQPAVAPTRTLYGVVKDSNGVPLSGVMITVAMAPAARAVAGKPASTPDLKITTDEDGFFKLDGVPPDVEAKVTVTKDSYLAKTLISSPAEAGKKMVVFLPRAEPAPVAVAQARPAAPPPTLAIAAPPPTVAAATPVPRPAPPTATPVPRPAPPTATPVPRPAPPTSKPESTKPTPAAVPPPPARLPTAAPPPPTPPAALANVGASADELALVAYRTFLAEDFKEAENAARVALQADPDNAMANAVLGNAMAALGVNTGDRQKTDAAKVYIEKALARDANMALGHSARGLTLFAEGKPADARSEFEKAVQLDPRLGTARSNLGYILSSQNKLPEAERQCREAIRLQPESAVPYNCLSDVLFKMGKYKDSAKASREAIGRYELRDRLLGLYYVQLAVTQFQQGKREEALEAVGRAKALGVDQHEAYPTIEKAKSGKKKG